MNFVALLMAATLATNQFVIPVEFQKNNAVWIQTMTQDQINHKCGKASKGFTTLACGDIKKPYIYMPNPCTYPEAKDTKSYAHLLCHEIAHTEGWEHPQ